MITLKGEYSGTIKKTFTVKPKGTSIARLTPKKKVVKLKAKKKYYVRIRTYKTVKLNGKTQKLYSGWSKAKKVTTKK